VIHFFWDRILGTYRRPDAGQPRDSHKLAKASIFRGALNT
jgi:sterol desaturase/sphingolipid hydroxylase (fatty acid hydroxylase superfamily)